MLNTAFECFDWDEANVSKCEAHGVSIAQIESALAANALVILPDTKHSTTEDRYIAAGRTAAGDYLFIAFTFRRINGRRALRPITARYMHRKEARQYEQARTQIKKR